MLNKERVRLMTKLARYEQREGKRYLKIGRFYRSDYIGIALLKNFFASTIAYVLILVLIYGYRMEAFLRNLNELNIQPMILEAVAGYLIMLAVFSGIAYIVASIRYAKAKKSVESYYGALGNLVKLYEEEQEGRRGKIPPDGTAVLRPESRRSGGYHS